MNANPSKPPAEPVRLGYVLKMFPRLSETFILNEILELEQQGLAMQIFSLRRPVDACFHAQTKSVRSGVTYLPEKIRREPWRVLLGQIHVGLKHRRRWWHALRNLLRRFRSDGEWGTLVAFCQACCLIREMRGLRHLHAHYANLPAKIALQVHRLTGTSYSITTHAKDIFQDNPFASPKLRDRLGHARFVIANSRFSAGHIAAGLNGAGDIHTIYNGLDLDAFQLRTQSPVVPRILCVGRLVEKKGIHDLITACWILQQRGIPFTCELVGTGPLSQALKEHISHCGVGDRVKLLGPLPQEVLREHYARAMAFALPCIAASDGDRDILPNVLKEAMAVGVPVVTTRLEGIEELIEDGVSGLLIAPGDTADLAAKLEGLLRNAALRHRLAVQGRKVIEERFDRRTNFAGLKTLLVAAVGQAETEANETKLNSQNANCLH